MAIENLIESRIENPKIRIYSEEDKKFYAKLEEKGYKYEIKKIILVDAFDNLIFCATDDLIYYYYAYKCKNTADDVNEVLSKTKGITKDSPCYSFNCLNFPEKVSHSFYEFEGEVYYDYFSLNDELDRIQRKIDFLNHENALVHSLESTLKNVKYTFDLRPFSGPFSAADERNKVSENLAKINFLLDFKFLVLAKDKALRDMYISHLDGLSKHSALEIQYEESLHR